MTDKIINNNNKSAASKPPLPPTYKINTVSSPSSVLTKNIPILGYFRNAVVKETSSSSSISRPSSINCPSFEACSLSSLSSDDLDSNSSTITSCDNDDRYYQPYNTPPRQQPKNKGSNLKALSPTVPSHLSPFYPEKYLVLGCDEHNTDDFSNTTTTTTGKTSSSVISKIITTTISTLSKLFLNTHNLWYVTLLTIAAAELIFCCWPHLLSFYTDYYSEGAGTTTSSSSSIRTNTLFRSSSNNNNNNKLMSLFGLVLIQQRGKIFDAIEKASLHKLYELYHNPQAYYYSSQSSSRSTCWSKPLVESNTNLFINATPTSQRDDIIHLIFLAMWFVQYTKEAWGQSRKKSIINHHRHQRDMCLKTSQTRRLYILQIMESTVLIFVRFIFFLLILSAYLTILPIFEEQENSTGNSNGLDDFRVVKRTVSLLDLLLLYASRWFHNVVLESAQKRTLAFCFKSLIKKAITNPSKFINRLKQFLTFVRYAKFLAPLIGQCNKLRGHASDLVKQWHQRLSIVKAQSEWKFLMRKLSVQRKTNFVYAKIVQKVQERREKKMLAVIRTLKEASLISSKKKQKLSSSVNKDSSSVAKACINAWLCQKAAHARKRAAGSCSFSDNETSSTEKINRKRCRIMTNEERMLLGMAKRGFVKTSCANRKMLLRPNTKFAVTWKITTVTCVFLEILQTLFLSTSWGEKYPKFLQSVSSAWLKNCLSWISFIATFAIGVVCYLDVFISFWTGEIVRDEITKMNKLVQKSFFNRWIFPGVLLQLVVNPTMAHVVKLLHHAFWAINAIGFSRLACITMIYWSPASQAIDFFSALIWEKTMEWHI
jgi:hypothetical protein